MEPGSGVLRGVRNQGADVKKSTDVLRGVALAPAPVSMFRGAAGGPRDRKKAAIAFGKENKSG